MRRKYNYDGNSCLKWWWKEWWWFVTFQEIVSLRTISIKAFYSEAIHCIISAFYERHNMIIFLVMLLFKS